MPEEAWTPRSRDIAELVFPELRDWGAALDRLGVGQDERVGLAAQADAGRWSIGEQLLASQAASEAAVCDAVAAALSLPREAGVEAGSLLVDEAEAVELLASRGRGLAVRRDGPKGRSDILLSLRDWSPHSLARFLAGQPGLAGRLRLATLSAMRAALWQRASGRLSRNAAMDLFERRPDLSARIVLAPWQGVLVGAGMVLVPLGFALEPLLALTALHAAGTLFFMSCVALRVGASAHFGAPPSRPPREDEDDPPVYSVLVALYREADVAPDLVAALEALDWPAGRLEVKLICEADDRATIEAIRACRPPPHFEIVEVPPGQPRTKPKALNYAFPATSGEFVVLYDAEDRPDRRQLREAHRRFRGGGEDLACLQAPLVVANADASLLSRMFAAEYAALFRALLPYLARFSSFLPLGGTSSHFRRSALTQVGAWDPFNVTEDADLGLRLARAGFRTETIERATLEDGPETLKVWLPQRARWFKGWVQTWLVHMRRPVRLWRELGPGAFLVAQIVLVGTLGSALLHPLLVATMVALVVQISAGAPIAPTESKLLLADAVNIACGHGAFLALVWRGLDAKGRRRFGTVAALTPLYWMLISAGAWLAIWQLWRRPHYWNKTPHRRARDLAAPTSTPPLRSAGERAPARR